MRRQMLVVGILSLIFSTNIIAQCVKGNCQNGYGTYTYKSGATYKGDFKNGRMQGQGVLYFSNGDRYIGQWTDRHREGKGKYVFTNGDTYQGHFKANKFEGQGFMAFANGDEYDGEWKEGLFHGQGTMTYANNEKYTGDWRNNKKHGQGTFFKMDGRTLEGEWINNKYQSIEENTSVIASTNTSTSDKNLRNCNNTYCDGGEGIYTYSDGSKYVGEFKDGNPQGYGTTYYLNGDKYVGQWHEHSPHGEGIYTYANKSTVAAIWSNGNPVRPLETLTSADESSFVNIDRNSEVKIWSVVVGVSTYEHMPALRYTDDDAYRFFAFLKSPEGGALSSEQVKILIDEDATRNNILSALRETLLKADENDVILFYYSGHGLEGSFIPVDFDGFNNRLMHDEIKAIFDQSKAKHKIIFADACYSGSLLAMKSSVNSMMKKYYQSFENTSGGLAFFTSSQGEEISLEDGGLRQGIFTHFLIRGLNGEADLNQNKIVTIKELYDFVSDNVRTYTAKVQTPVLTGNYDKNMPVAMIR